MTGRRGAIVLYTALLAFCIQPGDAESQERYAWTGGTGTWHVETNWSPAGIPAEEDTAVVSSGTVIVDTLTSVAVMDLRGGRLRASDTLNIDRMRMTGGRFSGAGAIKIIEEMDWPDGLIDGRNQGGANLIILQGAVLHLQVEENRNVNGGVIDNHGTIIWTGSATLNNSWATTLNNHEAGLIEIHGRADVTRSNSRFTFHNSGRLVLYGDENPTRFRSRFNSFRNHGIIEVESGELRISTGHQNDNTGSFSIADGAALRYSGGTHHFDGSTFSGEGSLRIQGGAFHADGEVDVDRMLITGGELHGVGEITVLNEIRWISGQIHSNGVLRIPDGATFYIDGPEDKRIRNRHIVVEGTMHWWDGDIDGGGGGSGAVFEVMPGGLFDVRSDRRMSVGGGAGSGSIINHGTIRKVDSTGTTDIGGSQGFAFHNHGMLRVESGTFRIGTNIRASESTGGFFVADGARLRFSRDDRYTFKEGTSITGAGRVDFDGAGVVVEADVTVEPEIHLNGGEIQGPGELTAMNRLIWTTGRISSSGSLRIPPGSTMSLEGPDEKRIRGRHIKVEGTLSWLGESNVNGGGGAVFEIAESGVFDIRSNGTMSVGGGAGRGSVVNYGTIRKTDSTGVTRIGGSQGFLLHNHGLIQVETGTLRTGDSSTFSATAQNTGRFEIAEGATLRYSAGRHVWASTVEIAGHGTLDLRGSEITNHATISPGLSTGVLTVRGDLPISSDSARVEIELGGLTPGVEHDRIDVEGEVFFDGTLDIRLADGYLPEEGDLFTIMTFGSRDQFDRFDETLGTVLENGLYIYPLYDDSTLVLEVSHPRSWTRLDGRSVVRPRGWQTYNVHYGNDSTEPVVIPIVIQAPPEMEYRLRFDIFESPLVEYDDPDTEAEFTRIPTEYTYIDDRNPQEIIIEEHTPLMLVVEPGETGMLPIQVRSRTQHCWGGAVKALGVEVGDPIGGSSLGDCLLDIGDVILGLVPGGPCIRAGVRLARNMYSFKTAKPVTTGSFIASSAMSMAQCAASLVPARVIVAGTIDLVQGFARGTLTGAAAAASTCIDFMYPRDSNTMDANVRSVCPMDPNDKLAKDGAGPERYIRGLDDIEYTILFENVDTAQVAARNVVITDTLDADAWNFSTFELGEIAFADWTIEVPGQSTSLDTIVDLRPQMDLVVDVRAGLNHATGVIEWTFTSLDPETGEAPEDPFAGFLPPNQEPPEGDGYVTFTVLPRNDLESGTQLVNEASIVFDTEEPILTGAWINTIDKTPPMSRVENLGETQASVDFEVAWSGEDDFSGIDTYTIFVSEDGGPFSVWLADTSITSAVFEGEPDVTYGFYSIAVDGVGNVEPEKTEADAVTTIRPVSTEEDLAGIPESFELYRNYPNPFNPATRIRYDVPERGDVRITVYDALGRRITTLVDEMHSPGRYDVTFDAAALPSGLYLYRMEAGAFRQVRRMVVVK